MKKLFLYLVFIALLISVQQVNAIETIKPTTHLQKVVKTAKERLGKKFADEQRVNNCKVPLKKIGSKPRPGCLHWVKN